MHWVIDVRKQHMSEVVDRRRMQQMNFQGIVEPMFVSHAVTLLLEHTVESKIEKYKIDDNHLRRQAQLHTKAQLEEGKFLMKYYPEGQKCTHTQRSTLYNY